MIFIIGTSSICVFVTLASFLLAKLRPAIYLKKFPTISSVVLALSLGPMFWNCAILAVDTTLIYNLDHDKYIEVSEIIRKLMFPAALFPVFILIQALPLKIIFQNLNIKYTKSEN